ncbi:MAG: uracil-DNA glycosylase [Chloroflexota bacterium]|nr:uracil-DNA glycosylase [Chloroflexota bacterium]
MAGGSAAAWVLVIGQAPGVRTMRSGKHFSGPGGKILRDWIAQGGIPLDRQPDEVYLSSLTRCFPGPAPRGGAGDRRPTPAELRLCRPFLEREFQILDPALVLLVGSMAIQAFLGRVTLDEAVGTLVERDGRHWLPLPHPSGVSRWLNDQAHSALVATALEEMRQLVGSRADPVSQATRVPAVQRG